MSERLAIAGSGAIACGLAAVAAGRGHVTVFARSEGSCDKASAKVRKLCERLGTSVNGNVLVSRDPAVLSEATFVVEAIVEDPAAKADMWRRLDEHLADDAVLATTTSSLPVSTLATASGHPERFVALHVFNPVPKMDLIELAFPPEATAVIKALAITDQPPDPSPSLKVSSTLIAVTASAPRPPSSTGTRH